MDDPRIEAEDMRQARGDYEDVSEREHWEDATLEICDNCGHNLSMHDEEHGCQHLPGDRVICDDLGNVGFFAAGPCGCKGTNIQDEVLDLMLQSWNLRMVQAARQTKQGTVTLMQALHRGGFFEAKVN